MSTLKQIFKKQRIEHYHLYGDTIPYNPINGVKEWLQQKREYWDEEGCWFTVSVVNELLEELNQ